MRRPNRTSWKLSGNFTEQALTVLRRIYKKWAPCLLEIIEYSAEKKYIKCKVKVPKGDYCYTRVKLPYVTCIQQGHILAQLSIFFFYFLVRDGVIAIFDDEKGLGQIDSYLTRLSFWSRRELKEEKKKTPEELKLFLNKRAAEILLDLYMMSNEKETIAYERKVLANEDFILEMWWVDRYVGPTKLPGSIFKARGEYTRKNKTRECLLAEIHSTVYTKIFSPIKA